MKYLLPDFAKDYVEVAADALLSAMNECEHGSVVYFRLALDRQRLLTYIKEGFEDRP